MGIIDQNKTFLTCPACRISETLIAVEKGSGYVSSGWGDFSNSKHFDVESQDRGHLGPTVTAAKCKKCSCDITIKNG